MRWAVCLRAANWSKQCSGIGHAKVFQRFTLAVIRVYDEAGNVIDAHEHAGEFKESVWNSRV